MYTRIEDEFTANVYQLNGVDTIETKLQEDCVKISVKRKLEFSPKSVFCLEITYGALLEFADEKGGEHDWENVNLAKEFKLNGQFVLDNLMRRISLLTAEITSSSGQAPIIIKPEIAPKQ